MKMNTQRSAFDVAVKAFKHSLATKRAEAYVARDVVGMGRQEAARHLGRDPSTVDTQLQTARKRVELPPVTKIEFPTRVGASEARAVVIWFANDTALRYVATPEGIEEQTYRDGSVHQSVLVGRGDDELAEYALAALQMYHELRDDPDQLRQDWSPVYGVIVGTDGRA